MVQLVVVGNMLAYIYIVAIPMGQGFAKTIVRWRWWPLSSLWACVNVLQYWVVISEREKLQLTLLEARCIPNRIPYTKCKNTNYLLDEPQRCQGLCPRAIVSKFRGLNLGKLCELFTWTNCTPFSSSTSNSLGGWDGRWCWVASSAGASCYFCI